MGRKKTFLAGHAYVDSGHIIVGDPGYILTGEGTVEQRWQQALEALSDGEHSAEGEGKLAKGVAFEPFGKGLGVMVQSGHGDGIYPVYITLADDQQTVESLFITFTND